MAGAHRGCGGGAGVELLPRAGSAIYPFPLCQARSHVARGHAAPGRPAPACCRAVSAVMADNFKLTPGSLQIMLSTGLDRDNNPDTLPAWPSNAIRVYSAGDYALRQRDSLRSG